MTSKWTVAIFSSRESVSVLIQCIKAVLNASYGVETVVDVLINGNRGLSEEVKELFTMAFFPPLNGNSTLRIWFTPLGDKAFVWNEYLYKIRQKSSITYFIDGYVKVNPDAFHLISEKLKLEPTALAVSGVPSAGRSAKSLREEMIKRGGIHGNLYAIRGDVLEQMKSQGFQLPLGLYRTDSLLGAVLFFGLNPMEYSWDIKRILVHPEVSWDFDPIRWWRFKDIIGHFKRKLRQAQGTLENLAIREHLAVQRQAPENLPKNVVDLVGDWIADHPQMAYSLFLKQPLCFFAAKKLKKKHQDWSSADLPSARLLTFKKLGSGV